MKNFNEYLKILLMVGLEFMVVMDGEKGIEMVNSFLKFLTVFM